MTASRSFANSEPFEIVFDHLWAVDISAINWRHKKEWNGVESNDLVAKLTSKRREITRPGKYSKDYENESTRCFQTSLVTGSCITTTHRATLPSASSSIWPLKGSPSNCTHLSDEVESTTTTTNIGMEHVQVHTLRAFNCNTTALGSWPPAAATQFY
ncbi:uncharacterized protein LOC110118163 [Ceratitis capitata]|uniref:uncharacterized protein LOC110118163 n=1 Tax=Ceratitis capitata TaxID=7213 RepID=UPI000A10BED5|nr:uncharacterized protein LOC110118163 [Ceratitis capitata]